VDPYIVPAAVVILIALFALQPLGTGRIGRTFGPIMAFWFASIAVLGIWGIAQHPAVLVAIDPRYAVSYLISDGARGFLVLGAVFLCVTGAEALYADMGHFGARPIRLAWSVLVFPSLVLNYAGQAAIVLEGAPTSDNVFYRLCPSFLLIPFIGLATVATIIASQSIITGAFSMTRQAIQLGWLPRVQITQTSAEGYGQIYVGVVNWLLMIVTVALVLGFRKSDNLAAAYGIAVSATMLMTSVLLFIAMREVLRWPLAVSAALAAIFIFVDTCFFSANLVKIVEGGYIPVLLAAGVYLIMNVWHVGAAAVMKRLQQTAMPIDALMAKIKEDGIPRVPGTAVFLTRARQNAPPVMVWHLRHNRALHRRVLVVNVITESVPWIRGGRRLTVEQIAPDFWRAVARYGFMERPDLPALLRHAQRDCGGKLTLDDVTYYVGHETIIPRSDARGLPRWVEALFAMMERNSVHATSFFRLPPNQVVEIGREISI
jgi:KUP system potassium uptake protein